MSPRVRAGAVLFVAVIGPGCGLLIDLDPALRESDAAVDDDAGMPPPSPCDDPEGDIAHYHFEDTLASSGTAPAGIASAGEARYVEGPVGCGRALAFDGTYYVEIPHTVDWDRVRSFDFWMLAAPVELEHVGVIGRDALSQTMPGHVSVLLSGNGRIMVRVQPGGDLPHEARCTPPLEQDTWLHVGINVGEPETELWVNGEQMDDATPHTAMLIVCGQVTEPPPDLSGNQNPWVLGAGSWGSDEGAATPVETLVPRAAIDELRFSSARRDFGASRP